MAFNLLKLMAKKQRLLIKITPETTLREILAVNIYLLPKLQAISPYKVFTPMSSTLRSKKEPLRLFLKQC
jgi:hypothetical protein